MYCDVEVHSLDYATAYCDVSIVQWLYVTMVKKNPPLSHTNDKFFILCYIFYFLL